MQAKQACFSELDAAAAKPVHPLVRWYCVPRWDTQMLCGYRLISVGVSGGGIGVAGGSGAPVGGSNGSCRSCSGFGSSGIGISAAAAADELGALDGLAVRLVAALAVRQQRYAQQQPATKPKRKSNIITMIVNFTVLVSSFSSCGCA